MEQQKITISQALTSSFTKALVQGCGLTTSQEMKARSSALQIANNPTLAKCNPYSIVRYCLEIQRYDFSRDDCVYPVSYGNQIQVQVSARGYKELAMRSGKYKRIDTAIVYDCDTLIRDEITGDIVVQFNKDVSAMTKAKVVGYYAYALDKNGNLEKSVFWTKEQCENHGKTYSKSYNSVWAKSFDKMAQKTMIKQLYGCLDTSPLMESLKEIDQIVLGDDKEENSYKDNPLNDQPKQSILEDLNLIDVEPEEETGEIQENGNEKNVQ